MKRMIGLILTIGCLVSFIFSAQVQNTDKPLKGEWNFNPQEVWKLNQAGNQLLASPGQVMVAKDGTIYLFEAKLNINFIFDSNGKFIKAFGNQGEGPGEIRNQGTSYLAGPYLIISDSERFHYFKPDATFLRFVTKSNLLRGNNLFINEDELISAPQYKTDTPDGSGKIVISNLKTGNDKTLATFPMPETIFAQLGENKISITVPGLTPIMIMGAGNNALYYGMNDHYEIHSIDFNGKPLASFSLDRSAKSISNEDKRKMFSSDPGKPLNPIQQQIVQKTGNKVTFFSRIDVINGLVYVFESLLEESCKNWQVDIFSPEGKYLYHGVIQLHEQAMLSFALSNVVFDEGFLYVVLETPDGEVFLAKYKCQLPQNN